MGKIAERPPYFTPSVLTLSPSPTFLSPNIGFASGTNLTITASAPFSPPSVNGSGLLGSLDTASGLSLIGKGSITDVQLLNSGGNVVLSVPSGTLNIKLPGQLLSTIPTGTPPFVVASRTPVANLSIGGNAATASVATAAGTSSELLVIDDAVTVGPVYPTWVSVNSGTSSQKTTASKLQYFPSTGNLIATKFTGALSGNATTVTTNANLTGVITSVGNTTSINSQTGTGSKIVVNNSPTLITPNLGTPSVLVLTNATGTIAQPAWLSPVLLNSWTSVGSGGASAGYMIDTLGIVHLKGGLIGGTASTIFVLPVGYRPTENRSFPGYNIWGGVFCAIGIDTSGNVTSTALSGASLDGVSFLM